MKPIAYSLFILSIAILFASCASQNHIELAGHYKPNMKGAKDQETHLARQTDEISSLPAEGKQQVLASSDETMPDLNLLKLQTQQSGSSVVLTQKQKAKLERKLQKVESKVEKQSVQNATTIQQSDRFFSNQKNHHLRMEITIAKSCTQYWRFCSLL